MRFEMIVHEVQRCENNSDKYFVYVGFMRILDGQITMKTTDQTGYSFSFDELPERIISLVPSQTELLVDLGLEHKIAGITKFCVHPEYIRANKEIVGGTKNPDISKIRKLKPDLIIGNKEENRKEDIEILRKEFNVWLSDVNNLEDAKRMIMEVGRISGSLEKANKIAESISKKFTHFNVAHLKNKKVVYLIWMNPFMVVGANTFIDEMISISGMINVFGDKSRYPATDAEEIKKLNPDLILLSSEPFHFNEEMKKEIKAQFRGISVLDVDGEMFSWYGSRLLKFPDYISSFQFPQNFIKKL